MLALMVNIDNKTTKEIGLKSVFTFILNGLFSAFFVTSGVINFKGKIVASLLYFVLAILAIIPHRLLRVTQALKIVILIVLFVILAGVAARGDPVAEQKYENFNLGQKFNIAFGNDTFSMVVKGVKNDAKISISGKVVTTSGSFIIVTGDIENLGSKAVDFKFKKDPELKDDQNRLYTLYGAAIPVGKLQPSVAKEVSYVFEIPKDATRLKFIIRDKTDVARSVDLEK
ncbi:MAG: hypothetical protein Q8L01_00890 [Candidatus Woesebacteria bacterium]|nr:hypothetical protein [Candidatus Woesebacteria bacterium]